MSLNNQSNRLAEAGRPADGLAPIDEAVRLPGARPGRPHPLPPRPRRVAKQPVQPARRGRAPRRRTGPHRRSRHHLPGARPGRPHPLPARPRLVAKQPVRPARRARPDRRGRPGLQTCWPTTPRPVGPWRHPARPRPVAGRERATRPSRRRHVDAADLLDTVSDRARRGQARRLLRMLRTDHPAAVDTTWAARGMNHSRSGSPPHHRQRDRAAAARLGRAPTWTETLDQLAATPRPAH